MANTHPHMVGCYQHLSLPFAVLCAMFEVSYTGSVVHVLSKQSNTGGAHDYAFPTYNFLVLVPNLDTCIFNVLACVKSYKT